MGSKSYPYLMFIVGKKHTLILYFYEPQNTYPFSLFVLFRAARASPLKTTLFLCFYIYSSMISTFQFKWPPGFYQCLCSENIIKLDGFLFLPLLAGKNDIVDGNVRLILGFVWQMICHYSTFGERRIVASQCESKQADPTGTLLAWVNKTSTLPITNLTTDWNDGRAVSALVNALAPGKSYTIIFQNTVIPIVTKHL